LEEEVVGEVASSLGEGEVEEEEGEGSEGT
jgi:hypothetical protein